MRVTDTHERNLEEGLVIAGCGVRAVGTNETNTYRRTEQKMRINTQLHKDSLGGI